jgi:hypothetical protein
LKQVGWGRKRRGRVGASSANGLRFCLPLAGISAAADRKWSDFRGTAAVWLALPVARF